MGDFALFPAADAVGVEAEVDGAESMAVHVGAEKGDAFLAIGQGGAADVVAVGTSAGKAGPVLFGAAAEGEDEGGGEEQGKAGRFHEK